MNDQDEYPFARPRELEWLASRGLCDPQTAAEYVGRKLLSREVFAQARQEYQRATANYASAHYPEFLGKFTVRNPGLRTTTFRKDEEFLDQAEIAMTDWAECLRNTGQLRLRFLS